jgi:hypothetical protein
VAKVCAFCRRPLILVAGFCQSCRAPMMVACQEQLIARKPVSIGPISRIATVDLVSPPQTKSSRWTKFITIAGIISLILGVLLINMRITNKFFFATKPATTSLSITDQDGHSVARVGSLQPFHAVCNTTLSHKTVVAKLTISSSDGTVRYMSERWDKTSLPRDFTLVGLSPATWTVSLSIDGEEVQHKKVEIT